MRVTITKTIELEQIPKEIDESYLAVESRIIACKNILEKASTSAREGRYIDSAEEIEKLREVLVVLDKNIEEQQSLCLSYEKIRISKQMPEQAQSAPPQMGSTEDE